MRTRHISRFGYAGGLLLAIALSFIPLDEARSTEGSGLYVLLEVKLDQVLKDCAEFDDR